jgi:hypothetical protein
VTLTEKQFQGQVTDAAKLYGWAVYHTQMSKWSEAGWPDLALCRPPRLILAELKSDSPQARLSPDQARWLHILQRCPGIEVYLWKPPVESILAILKGPAPDPEASISLPLLNAQAIVEVLDDPDMEMDPFDERAIKDLRDRILGALGLPASS